GGVRARGQRLRAPGGPGQAAQRELRGRGGAGGGDAGRSREPGRPRGQGKEGRLVRAVHGRRPVTWASYAADLGQGLDNLLLHKLRSLLTMLGMIFGVAAVVSMLSIGAGAQQQVMAFIQQLGVRNLIVEAREAANWQEWQKVRKNSQGLSFKELRVIRANVNGIS